MNQELNISSPKDKKFSNEEFKEVINCFEKLLSKEENDLKKYNLFLEGKTLSLLFQKTIIKAYVEAGWRKVRCNNYKAISSTNTKVGSVLTLER